MIWRDLLQAAARNPRAETTPLPGGGTRTRIPGEGGEIRLASYPVFPGIALTYTDVNAASCAAAPGAGEVLEITHCRAGRMECQFTDEFCYLTAGDLAITQKRGGGRATYFPLGHYAGISILVDLNGAPDCLSCILDDVNVQPRALCKKYCAGGTSFIARSNPALEHIFSELYSVPPEIQKGYFKVKALELLLFLSGMDIGRDELAQRSYTSAQVALAKAVCRYLSAHMDRRYTLEQLSEIFHVSGTQIKAAFKGVYGVPIYTYTRTQKMQAAARLLRESDCTVLEIAGRVGYDNGSKFAGAFRDVMGVTPNEYRSQCGTT